MEFFFVKQDNETEMQALDRSLAEGTYTYEWNEAVILSDDHLNRIYRVLIHSQRHVEPV